MTKKSTKAKRKKIKKLLKSDGRPEPKFNKLKLSDEQYQLYLLKALNYCSYVFDDSERAKIARKYIKKHLSLNASNVPDYDLLHIGSMCWLIENGAEVSDIESHHNNIRKVIDKHNNVDVIKAPKFTIKKKDFTPYLIAELEGVLDDVHLRRTDIKQPYDLLSATKTHFDAQAIYVWFREQLIDIRKGGEGYDDMCEKEIGMMCSALEIIMNDCKKYKIASNKS